MPVSHTGATWHDYWTHASPHAGAFTRTNQSPAFVSVINQHVVVSSFANQKHKLSHSLTYPRIHIGRETNEHQYGTEVGGGQSPTSGSFRSRLYPLSSCRGNAVLAGRGSFRLTEFALGAIVCGGGGSSYRWLHRHGSCLLPRHLLDHLSGHRRTHAPGLLHYSLCGCDSTERCCPRLHHHDH